MSEPAGQVPTEPTGQEPAGTQDAGAAASQEQTAGQKSFDAAYVATLRAEAAAHRKRATDAEARLKAADDEKLSETEKLKKQAAEATARAEAAEEKARLRFAQAATVEAAGKLGFHSGARAFQLIQGQIEYDAAGEPTNVEALLKALAKSDAYLVKGPEPEKTTAASPAGGAAGAPKLDPKNLPSWGSIFKT